MKKVFDQTVRDLKREVNKKVLRVPGIEQKILDATSNERWGPHVSLLADIAQATRNYHEYQMIMNVVWKRVSDTGKNWRHVFKGLIVLEYLVAHGTERVIDDIREHFFKISALAHFQYIDSSGRDQGSNVRRKSQSLVSLVNDKERIQEVRQKALATRDKYRSSFAPGGRSPGGYGGGYDNDLYEGSYGSRYDNRNGNGRERDYGYRDDDRYGGPGDTPNGEGDRYSRDSNERYGRDYREDEYKGSHSNHEYVEFMVAMTSFEGAGRRSYGRERDSYGDDEAYSSRGRGSNADAPTQDDRPIERKLCNQQIASPPPNYEDVTRDGQDNLHDDRNGGSVPASVPKVSSPSVPGTTVPAGQVNGVHETTVEDVPAPLTAHAEPNGFDDFDPRAHAEPNGFDEFDPRAHAEPNGFDEFDPRAHAEPNGFDEFDPRGSVPDSSPPVNPAPVANSLEMDLFGSDPISSLALVSVTQPTTTSNVEAPANSGFKTNSFMGMPSASTGFGKVVQTSQRLYTETVHEDSRYMELNILERVVNESEEPIPLDFALLHSITENFAENKEIGRGGCGTVYKGILRNGTIAVKRLHNTRTIKDKMFHREVKSLFSVKHPNIVRFLGYCSFTKEHAIPLEGTIIMVDIRERLLCFEYIRNGSLEQHLSDELRGLEWQIRYQIIIGICKGLHYLHKDKEIIHMDLKPGNILLDDLMVPKITDFGLSRPESDSLATTTRLMSQGYTAPEYISGGKATSKSDIYSLGVIIAELVTGSRMKPNITKVIRRWNHRWIKSMKQSLFAYQQVKKCLELALRCIQDDPIDRPDISDIIDGLKEIDTKNGQTQIKISPCCMEDILGIEPLEIHIPFEDLKVSHSIELTNDTDGYIAFVIKPKHRYRTEPDRGVVPPRSKCNVTLAIQAQFNNAVPNKQYTEVIAVLSTRVDNGTPTALDIDIFIDSEEGNVVDEVNVLVVFGMPELAQEQ